MVICSARLRDTLRGDTERLGELHKVRVRQGRADMESGTAGILTVLMNSDRTVAIVVRDDEQYGQTARDSVDDLVAGIRKPPSPTRQTVFLSG